MTTYYISPNGSDSNNGLGPDASHASNKPWLTLGKAMATGSAVLPGDIVYFAPGYYWANQCTPIAGIASVGSPTQFIGDPTNAQGFKDGSGVLLSPGIPWLTTRTEAEGIGGTITTHAAVKLISAHTNKLAGVQFKKLALEASYINSSGGIIQVDQAQGSDILFEDCFFMGYLIFLFGGGTAPTAGRNYTVRRCVAFLNLGVSYFSTSTAAATADADLNILIEENLIFGGLQGSSLALGGAGGNIAGGYYFYNNTYFGNVAIATTASRVSTTKPVRFKGNNFFLTSGQSAANAGTSGQIVDDGYNHVLHGAVNTNCTSAATTTYANTMLMVLPHLYKWGLMMPRADVFGWLDAANDLKKFSASGTTTSDFFGRTQRPWGAGSSMGCFQAPSHSKDTSSAITGGGTNSLKITGAGEVSFFIPVNDAGFTVSVTTKSTSYGGTNYPQMIVVANALVGVTSDTTVTATSASEQTITTATITPTSKGVMEVRLISRSSSTTSTTHFDILTAT